MTPLVLNRTMQSAWIQRARAICPPFLWQILYRRFIVRDIPQADQYWPIFLPWLDPGFSGEYDVIKGHTLVSRDRCWTLAVLLRQALTAEGDVLEAGVFQGGTARLLKSLVSAHGRKFLLFDSFAGMDSVSETADRHQHGDFADTSLEAVREFVGSEPFVEYRKGWIPQTFAGLEDRRFCFAHIDLDLYQSILDSCNFVYERMSPGGVIVFDDYGFPSCPGARRAVDGFFADKPEFPLALQTGQAVVHKL
ncbi:MAG: TylF/MycF/NovP-related O-methyltransferase [Chthoniobacterales bacterium]